MEERTNTKSLISQDWQTWGRPQTHSLWKPRVKGLIQKSWHWSGTKKLLLWKIYNHMRKGLWWYLAEKIQKQNCICHRITKTCSQRERTAVEIKKNSKTFIPVVWGSGARANFSAFPWFVSVLLIKFLKKIILKYTHVCSKAAAQPRDRRLPAHPMHCPRPLWFGVSQDVSYTPSSEGQ